jgi:hypothetical protein
MRNMNKEFPYPVGAYDLWEGWEMKETDVGRQYPLGQSHFFMSCEQRH